MSEAGVATDARAATYADAEETRRESPQSLAMHTDHDCWGPCCSVCRWWGEATKPCHVCTDWKEALR